MENQWLTIEKIGQEVVLTKCSEEVRGEVIIPDGVTRIGSNAFCNCHFADLRIPASIKFINRNAFSDTSFNTVIYASLESLFHITLENPNANPAWPHERNGYGAEIWINNEKISECLVIPNSIETIGAYNLAGFHNLKKLTIPSSVKTIKQQGEWDPYLSTLDFEGEIPETNNAFFNCHITTLRVNTSKKQTRIPNDIDEALKRENGKVVYAIPEFCKEPSTTPGYIRVTDAVDDELIDLNTKYIVSVKPCNFEEDQVRIHSFHNLKRYLPHRGTKIEYANVDHKELFPTHYVYEPHKMVMEKIEHSLAMLSQQVGGISGLLNQIEALYNKGQINH